MSIIANTFHAILPNIPLNQLEEEVSNLRWICEDCLNIQKLDNFTDSCDNCYSMKLHVSYLDNVEEYITHLKNWKLNKI